MTIVAAKHLDPQSSSFVIPLFGLMAARKAPILPISVVMNACQ